MWIENERKYFLMCSRWRTFPTCATSRSGPRTTTSLTWASSPCGSLSSGPAQFYWGVIIQSFRVLRSIIVKKADSIVAVARYVSGVRLICKPYITALPLQGTTWHLGQYFHDSHNIGFETFFDNKGMMHNFRYNTIKYHDGRKEVKFISLLVGVNTHTIIIIIPIIIPGGPGVDHLHPAERGGAVHRPRHPSQRHCCQNL